LNERCASLAKEVTSLKAENDFLKKEIAETAAKAKAASEAKEQSKVEPAKVEPAKVEPAKTATPAPVHHQGKAKA
jgi:regulator of replication initiation timing